MVEPAEGPPEQVSFAERALRSMAWRSASRIAPAAVADLVAHLILERGAFAHLNDRQIALLAKALSADVFFASRLLARTPAEPAAQVAAEQFINRRAATLLSPETRDKFAVALSASGVTRDLIDRLSDAEAAALMFDQVVERNLSAYASGWQARRAAEVLVDALPDAEAGDLLFERIVARDLHARISREASAKAASYLGRQSGFAAAALSALHDADAADLAVAQLLDRKLAARLPLPQAERLAADLAALPSFAAALLRGVPDREAERDGVAAALATWEGLGEALVHKMPAREAAGLAAAQLLSRGLFEHVSAADNERLAESALSAPAFAAALLRRLAVPAGASAAALFADALAEAHPALLDRALRKAQPEFDHRAESYSQEGEDLILARVFEEPTGFYVDVGALHPIRFSNTYLLYRRGWRGVNIDATPGSMDEFRRMRPRDINVEALVSDAPASMNFHLFNEAALNTTSSMLAAQRSQENPNYSIVKTVTLKSRRLRDILEENVPEGQAIDYFTIDVEGADLDVLKSNDWTRFRPKVVVAELLGADLADLPNHEIARFLAEQGYQPFAKQYNSVFFRSSEAANVRRTAASETKPAIARSAR